MNVLLLSPRSLPLPEEDVRLTMSPSEEDFSWADWLISFGYRKIIKPDILASFPPGRCINIHISILPHNRGTSPNLWSWYDDTSKGSTIHVMDEGIDTGPVLSQRLLGFDRGKNHTLRTTYDDLMVLAVEQFGQVWPAIRTGLTPVPQGPGGSYHTLEESEALAGKFPLGWNTSVYDVMEAGRIARGKLITGAAPRRAAARR